MVLLAEQPCHSFNVRHFRCQVVLLWKDVISAVERRLFLTALFRSKTT